MNLTTPIKVTNEDRNGSHEPCKCNGAHLPLSSSCDSLCHCWWSSLVLLNSSHQDLSNATDDVVIGASCTSRVSFFFFYLSPHKLQGGDKTKKREKTLKRDLKSTSKLWWWHHWYLQKYLTGLTCLWTTHMAHSNYCWWHSLMLLDSSR
jgi:hypothetical protein